jgi:hypothetical protein
LLFEFLTYRFGLMRKFTAMRSILLVAAAVAGICVAPASAQSAEASAAVVEEVKGIIPGVEFMDYVSPGQIIDLGPQDKVVLGYISSCVRETIVGGLVSVGTTQSSVSNGSVERTKVACDSGKMQLSEKEASQGAATSFRSIDVSNKFNSLTGRPIVLHGMSPIIETNTFGTLVISRLDVKGERREIGLYPTTLARGRFLDLAKTPVAFTRGGTYVATLGPSTTYFRIDSQAKAGPTPVVGRLLRLE